jgi:hypothetical protein
MTAPQPAVVPPRRGLRASSRQNREEQRYEGEECRDAHPLPDRAQGLIARKWGGFRDHLSSSDWAVRSANSLERTAP